MPREDYYQRQEARRERLEAAAERARAKAAGAYKRADMSEEATGIPFGQPILVGHYSEGRHRAAIKRADRAMRTAIDESKRADRLEASAENIGNPRVVSSDAPDAVELLQEKLAKLEAMQVTMKAANKVVRAFWKAGNRADNSDDELARYFEKMAEAGVTSAKAAREILKPDFAGRVGFADYQLTNNGATIRQTKLRIAQLEAAAQVETKVIETNVGVQVVENAEANRIQLIFPGKPDEATRKILKGAGFRWAPSEGAWQRLLNNAARWAAERVVQQLTPAD